MKGLELSRAYYEEYGKPMIDTQLAQYKPYLAAGLVGEGSECLGFDDELSTDHGAQAGSEFFRWKDFIVNSPGFPTLRRTIWSGFVSRNAFWRR